MGGEPQEVTVPAALGGARFDVALARLAGVSRTASRRLIKAGEAGRSQHSQAVVRPSARVSAGETIWFRRPEPVGIRPCSIAMDVLHEDAHLAVVDKPAGIVTHPAPGHPDGTLVSGLLHRWPQVEGVGEYPRWGIVHRLDRNTSGAMVVALDEQARRGLAAALAARRIHRAYLALAHGRFGATAGAIEAPIERLRERRSVGAAGRPAVTRYRVIASWVRPPVSLLEVVLETGRTHQIRVHFESIGHHMVGDPLYGRPGGPGVDPGRVWLHARRLRFRHPITAGAVQVDAPLPTDLRDSLASLGPPDRGDCHDATTDPTRP